MERLGNTRPTRGLTASRLRTWAMLFAIAGIIGRSILQNQVLGMGSNSMQQILEMMQASETAMAAATAALVMQAMETVAVPIFVYLLVEGFQHTSDWKKYLLRVAGLALLTEIPYNLAMGQKLFDTTSRNPVLGLVLGLVLMYLFTRFQGKKLVCVIMALAGAAWAVMLKVDHGIPMILMVSILWIFRKKRMYMGFAGMGAAALCIGFSPFYLAAPMGCLVIHFYNGEQGEGNRLINYLFYPVMLLVIGLLAMFAL